MGKIIAIGGGLIGKPQKSKISYYSETTRIAKEIIKQSKKKNPKLLFMPTASNDSREYAEKIKKRFSKLGCKVSILYTIEKKISKSELEKKILKSDIIYVGGGNTLKMMNIWKKKGIDKILKKAYKQNIVLSGISAGSICWFKYGNSDSRKHTSGSKQLIKVSGLGLINALHCPHYDAEKNRHTSLKKMMKRTSNTVSIALDNYCAIEIIDDSYKIIKSKPTAKGYITYWKKGKYIKKEIPYKRKFESLKELLNKN